MWQPEVAQTTVRSGLPAAWHATHPGAFAFWRGWGSILTAAGEQDLTPRTEEEWKRVEDGAATVVIATNAIMIPAYAREPRDEWNKSAQIVLDVALRAKVAAEKKDVSAMSALGEELDTACDACHMKFDTRIKKGS